MSDGRELTRVVRSWAAWQSHNRGTAFEAALAQGVLDQLDTASP